VPREQCAGPGIDAILDIDTKRFPCDPALDQAARRDVAAPCQSPAEHAALRDHSTRSESHLGRATGRFPKVRTNQQRDIVS